MFIYITYKDAPELSSIKLRASSTTELDNSVEKTLLVNPNCPVRVMLEYIRKKCRLGIFTNFDICDENGALKGLFNLQTYAYATEQFEHKKTYYLIVIKQDTDKHVCILPQLNHDNKLYQELKNRVKQFILTGETIPQPTATLAKSTPPPSKTTPSSAGKGKGNKKI